MPCDEVPKVYRVNHVKRLTDKRNGNFEGQLPKLRYYHTLKKVEVPEVNNNNTDAKSVKSQPITASSKKNGSSGQMKITGLSNVGLLVRLKLTFYSVFADFLKEKKPRLTVTAKKKH